MQNHDILIRRQIASSKTETTEFFTLHRFPSEEKIAGPYPTEAAATEKALELAEKDGCDVWLQTRADPSSFESVN